MKVFMTGVAGTGKTTISRELKKRGYAAIDFSDVPDIRYWREKTTKRKILHSEIKNEAWFNSHERVCDTKKLKKILDKYENVIVSGLATGNVDEMVPLFDHILLLQCRPETFIFRMKTREHLYGKTKPEQQRMVGLKPVFEAKLLSLGATPINTEGDIVNSVTAVVSVLEHLGFKRSF